MRKFNIKPCPFCQTKPDVTITDISYFDHPDIFEHPQIGVSLDIRCPECFCRKESYFLGLCPKKNPSERELKKIAHSIAQGIIDSYWNERKPAKGEKT